MAVKTTMRQHPHCQGAALGWVAALMLCTSLAQACQGTCEGLFNVCMSGSQTVGCTAELNRCLANCRAGGAPARPLPPAVPWGYLVFDTVTGKSGASWGFSSGNEARSAAREACAREGGRRCDWLLPVRGGCVAVAHGDGNSGRMAHRKSGGREALKVARDKAVANCVKEGGRGCRVVAQACSWKL